MSPLETMITEYLAGLFVPYYLKQCAVIIALFVFGSVLCDLFLKKDTKLLMRAVLAYPTGLSAFVVTAYAMLTFGIYYSTYTVTAAVMLECLAALFLNRKSLADNISKDRVRHMITALCAAAAVALIACSGLIPVYISNDTMYYFKRYPECIVHYGMLRDQFDSWLTDTGLGSVCIDTLPSLFGFGESFGIRESFHISFLAFFGMTVYERSTKYVKKNAAIASAVIVTILLIVATPFLILGHWALANMYFMELFFIAAFTAVDIPDSTGAFSTMLIALSLLRMEGTLFAVWLVLCIALFTGYGRKLAICVLFPLAVLFGMYCRKIFFDFYIFDDIYVFLTPQKAAILISAVVLAAVYLLIVPLVPKKITRWLPALYIGGAIAVNLLLLVKNTELYVGNLKTFAANWFGQSGWGILPHFVIGMTAIVVIEYAIRYFKKEKGTGDGSVLFGITLTLGFILLAFIASYGRGDALSDYIGDSGNRVMLQVVPLIIITYAELFLGLIPEQKRGDS